MVDELYVNAGKRIRKMRNSLGYSEGELAEAAGITRKFLSEIETDKSGFSADTLFKIAKALQTDCHYILVGILKTNTEDAISETEELFHTVRQLLFYVNNYDTKFILL